ncbi:tyrosine-protein kinase domain-containing protein [Thermoleptolyngbya sp. PKUAC-SCTB121]|uniref:GumC family protein n=1 Tax=Thermoleptolyngbya sp. PKUAC-SCTB121 TaxID=2811482 RepID=UPI0019660F66|nr:tyrosine-protein kinase domain-containing protein [Thermoleptolyngbya sp. PKUAC-SCTB121]
MKSEPNFQPNSNPQRFGWPTSEPVLARLETVDQGTINSAAGEESWNIGWVFAALRRRAPIILGVATGTTAAAAFLILNQANNTPPSYIGSFDLLVEPVTSDVQASRQTTAAQVDGVGSTDVSRPRLDYPTQIRILRNPQLIKPLVDRLQARDPNLTDEVARQILERRLVVERLSNRIGNRDENTKIIRVSYQDSDPAVVLAALEELSGNYLKYALEQRQTSIGQAVQFIDDQLPALQEQVDRLQARLQAFRERNTLIDPALEGTQLTQQSGTLRQERLAANTNLVEARSRYAALAANDPVAILSQAPEYGTLLGLFQQYEAELATEAARMTDLNPDMQYLQERRNNIQQLINREARRVLDKVEDQIRVLEDRNRAIAQSESQIQQQIRNLPAAANEYDELQRQLNIATGILTEFSARQKALQVDAAQEQTPWELINPPTLLRNANGDPTNIASINVSQYLLLAALLGSLLGVGVGLLIEILADRYHAPDELKMGARLPVLGQIPLQPMPIFTADQQLSPLFLESFQSLLTRVNLLSASQPLRSLAISSATPEEGKSTVALYLAQAAASLGQRVLLVDADLRRPTLHERLSLPNDLGLTDLLSDNDVSLKQVIRRRSPDSSLYIITAGSMAPNPIRLLTSPRMQEVARQCAGLFDLVIYDTPPILNLADSSVVAAYTNGTLIVASLGQVQRKQLSDALETFRVSNLPILGIVANRVRVNEKAVYSAYTRV